MVATAHSIERSPADGGGGRRSWLLAAGVVLLVAALIGGIGLWVAAANRLNDAVRGLARAPIGCTTTLNFSRTGEFLVFVETKGELEGVRGDCDITGRFDSTGDEPPDLTFSIVDPDGVEVDLRADTAIEYDAAGSAGRSEQVVTITTTGDHVLTVGPDSGATTPSFAVAVGKDPNAGVGMLRIGAVLVALVGLVAGVAAIVLSRRGTAASTATAPGWPAGAAWPPAPTGGPPPGWPGAPVLPGGNPPGWPTQPPPMSPPAHPPTIPPQASAPPFQQPPAPPGTPATWDPAARPPPDSGVPYLPGTRPGGLSGPSAPRPADGSTGDGERSPWAPPHDGDDAS